MHANDIKYFLYTKNINGVRITRSNVSRISLDFSKQTVFVIHGWLESHITEMEQTVIDAYLQSKDVNIFAVDWNSFSRRNYRTSKEYVPKIGQAVAEFIKFLEKNVDLKIENLGIVGHSLGAHVAGNIGYNLNGRPNWLMGRNLYYDLNVFPFLVTRIHFRLLYCSTYSRNRIQLNHLE